jgi:hypothetical protein
MSMLPFWAKRSAWPHDPAGYVFLARALDEIGRAKFGNEWTGKESITESVSLLPLIPELARPYEKEQAHKALVTKRPEFQRQPVRYGRYGPAKIMFTSEEWAAARATVQHEHDTRLPALQRLAAVQKEIVKRCEAGELVSAIRPVAGGAMREVPRDWWNTEKWHSRFVMCQLNPRKPFELGIAGDNYCWIFVTRQSLDAYLRSRASAMRTTTVGGETAAMAELARMLRENENLGRDEARRICVSKFNVSQRGFWRIWPRARENAGLPPQARAGRKPKQS